MMHYLLQRLRQEESQDFGTRFAAHSIIALERVVQWGERFDPRDLGAVAAFLLVSALWFAALWVPAHAPQTFALMGDAATAAPLPKAAHPSAVQESVTPVTELAAAITPSTVALAPVPASAPAGPSPVFSNVAVPNPWYQGPGKEPKVSKDQVDALFQSPVVRNPDDLKRFQPAFDEIKRRAIAKWGEAEWQVLDTLIMHESRYDPRANSVEGACGIFQALQCSKMPRIDWMGQIDWAIDRYIPARYGTPTAAWAAWVSRAHPCTPPDKWQFIWCDGWY